MQEEGSTLQEVQQNERLIIASAASTPQGFHKGIPHTGGFKEPVQPVNVPSENFTGRPDRTEEKKGKYISHCENLNYMMTFRLLEQYMFNQVVNCIIIIIIYIRYITYDFLHFIKIMYFPNSR